jgi:hypothetical protein
MICPVFGKQIGYHVTRSTNPGLNAYTLTHVSFPNKPLDPIQTYFQAECASEKEPPNVSMHLSTLLFRLSSVLLPLSILSTTYLYLYPFFHSCHFPTPPKNYTGFHDCTFKDENLQLYYAESRVAPFRLLAFGDPQLEGDTSLPAAAVYEFEGFEHIYGDVRGGELVEAVKKLGVGVQDIITDIGRLVKYARKGIDLIGNDYYLAHIYRTLHWWTNPTHVTVLGDLLGSQWIGDEEFEKRSQRFWTRIFRGTSLPEPPLQDYKHEDKDARIRREEVLGVSPRWRNSIINLPGNHDIGYAGDIDESRIDRFEAQFGPVNGDIYFTLPPSEFCGTNSSRYNTTTTPVLRLVVLNSMNLDTPVMSTTLQGQTYAFVNSIIDTSSPVQEHTTSTILLTHIPLHKDSGICADEPFFSFFPEDEGGGVKEQNMISQDISKGAILHGIFGKSPDTNAAMRGLGRDGIILTGHDHVGCDVYHHTDRESGEWKAHKWGSEEARRALDNEDVPGLREVTLRSMMGEFGGHAGLISAWWDSELGRWRIEVEGCSLGVQHIWWAVHVLDLVVLLVLLGAVAAYAVERKVRFGEAAKLQRKGKAEKKKQSQSEVVNGFDKKTKRGANGTIGRPGKPAVRIKQ